jgi:Trypsin-like peptidase domain
MHVVRALAKAPKPPGFPPDKWPVRALLFHLTEAGQFEIELEVFAVSGISDFNAGKAYYGPKEGPDLGFVFVKAKGLAPLQIDGETEIEEGIEVATAGYPMGTDALTAPGWLHQITPTLQKGIVSAVLPYPCLHPHGFSINVMTQGGASGSPVISCTTGGVLGVLYGGLEDIDQTLDQKHLYRVPTAISYVVPSRYIAHVLAKMKEDPLRPQAADAITIDEMLQQAVIVNALEEDRDWKLWKGAQKPSDENG